MTDYSKLKVTELKDELKARGIPLTGLKLKQQFIEKLEELDSAIEDGPKVEDEAKADLIEADPEAEVEEVPVEVPAADKDTAMEDNAPEDVKIQGEDVEKPAVSGTEPPEHVAIAGAELPELIDSYSSAPKPTPSEPLGDILQAREEAKAEEEVKEKTDPPIDAPPTPQPVEDPSTVSTPVPAKELTDDSKKRKRRSATPPPSTVDIAMKKARARDGTPIITKQESSALEELQAATDAAKAIRAPDGLGGDDPLLDETRDAPQVKKSNDTNPLFSEKDMTGNRQPALKSTSPEPASNDRNISPAIHQATKSLYMRNFKRPLHILTLRKHIENLAQPPSSSGSEDFITNFHLDGIRTHALVSFKSVSAASRVRASMHDAVFPEEGTRIPIWVDFVPDSAVQKWVEKETSSSDRNRKWEVVYNKGADTMEATHQEISSFDTGRKPSTAPTRHISMTEALSRPQAPLAPDVHPDRATMVPRDERGSYDRGLPSRSEARANAPPKSDTGTGFKALDELFSSTTAKPKLYYKPVAASVADERLDMIKDLRVGHAEMGKSGDEGMKRYTLESFKGREEWVDKGPEFGYGRRGNDAFAGNRGRGRGGFRGGGGGGRGFDRDRGSGDSWRGRY